MLRKLSNQKSNTDIKVGKDLSKKNKDLDKIVEEGVEAVVKDDTEDENMEQNDNELEQTGKFIFSKIIHFIFMILVYRFH